MKKLLVSIILLFGSIAANAAMVKADFDNGWTVNFDSGIISSTSSATLYGLPSIDGAPVLSGSTNNSFSALLPFGTGPDQVFFEESYSPGFPNRNQVVLDITTTSFNFGTNDIVSILGSLTNIPDIWLWNHNGITGGLTTLTGVNVVPVPAAAWLFGSGLIGLLGLARRKR